MMVGMVAVGLIEVETKKARIQIQVEEWKIELLVAMMTKLKTMRGVSEMVNSWCDSYFLVGHCLLSML